MTDPIRITDVTITAEQKEFLNQLRRSGVVNMFGAGPYVAEEFGLTSSQARTVLVQWMEDFEAAATTTTTDS